MAEQPPATRLTLVHPTAIAAAAGPLPLPGWTPPPPATREQAAKRLAAGILHADMPTPCQVTIDAGMASVRVEHLDQLPPWAYWIGSTEPMVSVYSHRPGKLIRETCYRAMWRGYVFQAHHLCEFPMAVS